MTSLLSLPSELQLIVLDCCDFISLLQLRQVSTYYKQLVEQILYRKLRFHVACEYFTAVESDYRRITLLYRYNGDRIVFEKMHAFIRLYMPNLRDFSLRRCAILLTLSNLIQLASVLPNLHRLDLSQVFGKPYFETNTVLALQCFRQLKELIMEGFVAQKLAGKGCSHWLVVPPLRYMQNLEVLELDCPCDTLLEVLGSLFDRRSTMGKLRKISFSVKNYCSILYPSLLTWFLFSHRSLSSVRICNVLFATNDQLRRFYLALALLQDLTELHLEGCALCDQIDSSIQLPFVNITTLRGIRRSGLVQSLRYDPNNIH